MDLRHCTLSVSKEATVSRPAISLITSHNLPRFIDSINLGAIGSWIIERLPTTIPIIVNAVEDGRINTSLIISYGPIHVVDILRNITTGLRACCTSQNITNTLASIRPG